MVFQGLVLKYRVLQCMHYALILVTLVILYYLYENVMQSVLGYFNKCDFGT